VPKRKEVLNMYNEFKGKIISEVINNEGNIIIKFTDKTYAEIYNCGEIINGDIELEIDLLKSTNLMDKGTY
jgi:hypothetical protein